MIQIIAQPATSTVLHDCRVPEDLAFSPVFNDCCVPEEPDVRLCNTEAIDFFTDCAIPPEPACVNLPPLFATQTLRQLLPHPLLHMLPLDAEYVVAFVPSYSHVVVLNRAAREFLTRLPLTNDLSDSAACQVAAQLYRHGLVTLPGQSVLPPPTKTRTLAAWLHITSACNLSCSYCYVRATQATMTPAIAHAAVDSIIRSAVAHNYATIALKYAGGEASLHMPLVADTQRYALEQAQHYGLGVRAVLLSNGTTLSSRTLHTLGELGIQLTVSLDGNADFHNLMRPTRHGQPSFQLVWDGLERAIRAGIRPDIAITVTRQNMAGLPPLLSQLLAHQLRFSMSFYRENDWNGAVDQLRAEDQQLIDGLRQAYASIAQTLPRWSLLGNLLDRTNLSTPRQRVCGAGHDYLVIDTSGHIAQCQMTMHRPVTNVQVVDPLGVLRGSQGEYLSVDEKEDCQSCIWRYWCGGGCKMEADRAVGRADTRSPNCAIYTALYPDVLQLEGKRLLHQFGP